MATVEFFVPVAACACAGAAFTRDMDRISRLEKLMEGLAERFPGLEIVRRAPLAEEKDYADDLKALSSLLWKAGEEDLADRVAFSLKYVLPAVAVNEELVAYGRVPDIEEIARLLEEA